MRRLLPTRNAVILVVAAAIAATVTGVAIGSVSQDTLTAAPAPVRDPQPPVRAVDPSLAAQFALLRGSSEGAPAAVRKDFETSGMDTRLGLNLDLAQELLTPASSTPSWVVPGNRTLCIWIKDPVDGAGISCDPTDQVVKTGLFVTLVKPGVQELTIAGLVPDGTGKIVLAGASDAAREVANSSGTFGAEDTDATQVSLGSGPAAQTVPLVRPDAG